MEISAVNLIFSCIPLRPLRNSLRSSSVCGQIMNTSSMYRFQRLGCLGCWDRNFSSSSPTYMVANAGANLVPMAIPHTWVKMRSLNLNTLFFSTYFKRSNKNTFKGWDLNFLSSVVMASSCVMLVYRLSISRHIYQVRIFGDF